MTQDTVVVNYSPDKFDIFNYRNLGSVRAYLDDRGRKWFCLVDVCNILTINQASAVLRRMDNAGVILNHVGVQTGIKSDGTPAIQTVPTNFINEGNLFRLIMGSRKQEAKEFTNWVCDEVLPALNNKGYYIVQNTNSTDTDTMRMISEELDRHNKQLVLHNGRIKDLENKVSGMRHTIAILQSEGMFTISGFAKFLGVPLTLDKAQELGRVATEYSCMYNIPIASMSHPEFTNVNLYKYSVLQEVFKTTID